MISPLDSRVIDECKKLGAEWINEEIFDTGALVSYKNSIFREWHYNWLNQQFIKLQVDRFSKNDFLYLLDVDTVLLEPIRFDFEDKIVVLKSDEWHQPYFDMIKRVFPEFQFSRSSFITHQFFLKSGWLKEIRSELETISGGHWTNLILDNLDHSELNGFSEYELIGNWLLNKKSSEIVQAYWYGDQNEDQKNLFYRYLYRSKKPDYNVIFRSNHNRIKYKVKS